MFHGSIPALVTPMHDNGSIDYDSLEKLIDWHIEQGSNALVVLGTTGESPTISNDERPHLIEFVVDRVDGRVPVIVGTGTNSTQTTIDLTQQAMDLGADAALIVTPYYNKPTQAGLIAHFEAVADAVSLPIILYNVPGRTGCDILPETVAELAPRANIIGIKEATGDIDRISKIKETCKGFKIYSGDDATAFEALKTGADGVISVTANVAPGPMAKICQLVRDNDLTAAADLNAQIAGLHQALFIESNPIPVKWAVHEMGLIPSGIRLPLTPLAPEYREDLLKALRLANISF